MRKRIIDPAKRETATSDHDWLDLEKLAEVEITSEDPAHPIECALIPGKRTGWRAAQPGEQTIRLRFVNPQQLRRIRLSFEDTQTERTQEYVLRWSEDQGRSFHELLRQQWNFSPLGGSREVEDHLIELPAVTALELCINPSISGHEAYASLEELLVA